MKILLLIILCSASGILYSQIDTVATVTYTEKMPAFPGGQTEMYRYIYVNMKYPPLALKNKIKGVVHVQFVVTETGEITNTTVTRGVSHDLDEEAV